MNSLSVKQGNNFLSRALFIRKRTCMSITIREIEDIESGLKILSYECDDFLNDRKFSFGNFYQLYIFYSGFIGHLRHRNWKASEIREILTRFPTLFQPSWIIILPALGYVSGLWFASSVLSLVFFVAAMVALFLLGMNYIKKKLRTDLLIAIQLTAELRLHLHKVKAGLIADLLS